MVARTTPMSLAGTSCSEEMGKLYVRRGMQISTGSAFVRARVCVRSATLMTWLT